MTDTQELNELYEIMTEIGIWPEHITRDIIEPEDWIYIQSRRSEVVLYDEDISHIARGIAEEWLIERGCCIEKARNNHARFVFDVTPDDAGDFDVQYAVYESLPDALRYAKEQMNSEVQSHLPPYK